MSNILFSLRTTTVIRPFNILNDFIVMEKERCCEGVAKWCAMGKKWVFNRFRVRSHGSNLRVAEILHLASPWRSANRFLFTWRVDDVWRQIVVNYSVHMKTRNWGQRGAFCSFIIKSKRVELLKLSSNQTMINLFVMAPVNKQHICCNSFVYWQRYLQTKPKYYKS